MAKTLLEELRSDPDEFRLMQQERLIVAITESICKAMKRKGIKRIDLANALKKTRGRISQYLDGEKNLTLRTVADLFTAVGMWLPISPEPIDPSEKTGSIVDVGLPSHWGSQAAWKESVWTDSGYCPNDMAA